MQIIRFLLLMIGLIIPFAYAHASSRQLFPSFINQKKILMNSPDLDPKALNYAIKGYKWALKNKKVGKPNILTVIDFDLPAYAKRMWVINLKTSKVLMDLYTTQGKGSGLVYARHFSNNGSSLETSLGVYKILNPYIGKHGLSLRLEGLEKYINNNAYKRAVVIHPAWYATAAFVKKYNRTGRSWGCFAIDPAISKKYVELTKNGSILFAYASPEQHDPYIG